MTSYIITIILSVVSAVLAYILKEIIKENRELREKQKAEEGKREKALSNGVLSLLRIQLIEYHDKYMMRDSVPVYALENWDEMYQAYAALGGNGTVKKMNDNLQSKRIGRDTNESR